MRDEIDVVTRQQDAHPIESLPTVTELPAVLDWHRVVRGVHIDHTLVNYAVGLVTATRSHPEATLGASPRASLGLVRLAQAWALRQARDFVLPDDVKRLALAVLAHRIVPKGLIPASIIVEEILDRVPVPVLTQ